MSLNHLVLTSKSGIAHPYYSVTPLPTKAQEMLVRVASYPPLDSVTTVSHEQSRIQFHVLVECEADRGKLIVELWHNAHDRSQWQATPLSSAPDASFFSASKPRQVESSARSIRKWFAGAIDRKGTQIASFTIRFKLPGDTGYRWVRDEQVVGSSDGRLIFSSPMALRQSHDLSEYVSGLDSQFIIESTHSDTPNTLLWSITAPAAPAKGETSGYSNYMLGMPVQFIRWFSLVRLWSPWLAPRQGREVPFAEKDAILYSFLREDAAHVACLAISGVEDVVSVFRFEREALVVNARNDREETGTVRVLVAVGESFSEAIAAVVYRARTIIELANPMDQETRRLIDERKKQAEGEEMTSTLSWVNDWLDGFTYCTWNGLGQNLTQEAIMGALESLKQHGVSVTNLIIDDNWQSLDNEGHNQMERGWTGFEANPNAFPNGLKPLTSNIRSTYYVRHIAVWHALLGYWGGISPSGTIAKNYSTRKVVKRKSVVGGSMTVVDASSVEQMYDDFYKFLIDSGIDGVKTDAQFFLDEIDTAPARRSLTSKYLKTWTSLQLKHFGGNGISCMSQSPQILFPCQLASILPAIPVRNSDDFFPDVEESHPWHIFCNSHNAILAQYLKVFPDWDMFQTHHKWGAFHAAARCVSGGPIYITDTPGKHDVDLIHQMTATTTAGQTVILRPSIVGRSVEAYVGFEDEKLHKISAYDGMAKTGSSFLGVFNLRESPITDLVHFSDFLGTDKTQRYAVRHHIANRTEKTALTKLSTMSLHNVDESVFGIRLEGHSWNILTATPLYGPFDVSEQLRGVEVSNLGLTNKMAGAAAIRLTEISVMKPSKSEQAGSEFSKLHIYVSVKALGVLGILISSLGEIDWKQRVLVELQQRPMPAEFAKVLPGQQVLELDIEGAWKHMKLVDDGSNYVVVQVYVH